MTEIILPPMQKEEEEKIVTAIRSIGVCMDTDVKIEEVVSLKVTWPNSAGNVGVVINDLVGIKTKRKYKRGKDPQIGQRNEDFDSKNL